MKLDRVVTDGGDGATTTLTGQLALSGGFDAFADADLLAAIGGSPYADQITASGATPASALSVTLRASLAGKVEDTNGRRRCGSHGVDGAASTARTADVRLVARQSPSGGGFWSVASMVLLVLLVVWLAAATVFIVSVGRARARKAQRRRRALSAAALTALPSWAPMGGTDETEVAIVGAGPAGLVLAHLLAARGIDCVVLEQRDRAYVEHRVRAGVLEHPTVELLRQLGLAERLDREGLAHRGIQLAVRRRSATASTSSS